MLNKTKKTEAHCQCTGENKEAGGLDTVVDGEVICRKCNKPVYFLVENSKTLMIRIIEDIDFLDEASIELGRLEEKSEDGELEAIVEKTKEFLKRDLDLN